MTSALDICDRHLRSERMGADKSDGKCHSLDTLSGLQGKTED